MRLVFLDLLSVWVISRFRRSGATRLTAKKRKRSAKLGKGSLVCGSEQLLSHNSLNQTQMILRASERGKKSDPLVSKPESNNPAPPKRHLLQSQEFGSSVRRHSVYGTPAPNLDYAEPLTNRVSSRELKSLQKYKSTGREGKSAEKTRPRRRE